MYGGAGGGGGGGGNHQYFESLKVNTNILFPFQYFS